LHFLLICRRERVFFHSGASLNRPGPEWLTGDQSRGG